MQNVSVSRRYARALVDAAGPDVDAVLAQLEALLVLLESSPDVGAAIASPALSRAHRVGAVEAIARVAGFHPMLTNLLKLLVDRNRMEVLPQLTRGYRDLVDARIGRVRGKVTSAVGLTAGQLAAVCDSLESLTQRRVLLESTVDASLLGGVVAQVGSRTYDGSLKTQLRELGRQLSSPMQ
jgi:F-type H+-transporting ATPase subunit delta